MNRDCNLIVAVCKNWGIGYHNTLPWYLPEDLKYFKRLTNDNVVVMGTKTFFSLPESCRPLSNRINIIITRDVTQKCFIPYRNMKDVIIIDVNNLRVLNNFPDKNIFVIGGSTIYKLLNTYIKTIYLTYIDKHYDSDVFFDKIPSTYTLNSFSDLRYDDKEDAHFRYLIYNKKTDVYSNDSHDVVYKSLASRILARGTERTDRTGTGTMSMFGDQIRFDISKSVPILTSKRIPWKSCIEELLWFLRGDTDAKILQQKNVHIWDGNSSKEFLNKVGLSHLEEGDCGANYSFQWRHFGADYNDCNTNYTDVGTDQIKYIENLLLTDPTSRRIFLSAWNPCDLKNTVLPPCHVSAQFYVSYDKNGLSHLSCHMYQRSCDVFLGLPWNILSYTVLTYILAKRCNMIPSELIISLGDAHIYKDHITQINTQLKNNNLVSPVLQLSDKIIDKKYQDININDFEVIGYFSHPSIKAHMSV